jgi:predicted amidohydrolase YtcJ
VGSIVLTGGPIHTCDPDSSVVDGLVVVDDRVAYAGDAAAADRFAPPDAVRVDLSGRSVVPGFVDAHNHLAFTGAELNQVDVRSPAVGSIADLVARIAEAAERTPDGVWIRAVGMNDNAFSDGRLPTRWDLDEATRVHPVLVTHMSGHHALGNSLALERRGLGDGAADPEGGHLLRDDRGRLTGYARDAAQQLLVPPGVDIGHHGPGFHDDADLEEVVGDVARASLAYAAVGITSICDAQVTRRELDGYREARRRGLLDVRVTCMPISSQQDDYASLGVAGRFGDDWLAIGPMKFYADGALTGGTACFSRPYGASGEFSGSLYWASEASYANAIERAHRGGWQVGTHAQGDRAIDRVLDAYESAMAAGPRDDPRHRIEHAGGPRPDQIERMASLGVFAIGQPRYFWDAGDDWLVALDPERAHRLQPYRELAAAGVPFVISTDAPVVSYRPLETLWSAVTRRTVGGSVVGADQALTLEAALRAYTIDAARSFFVDGSVGSLEPGKLADLVVFDADLFATSLERLPDVPVALTVLGGRIVAGSAAEAARPR